MSVVTNVILTFGPEYEGIIVDEINAVMERIDPRKQQFKPLTGEGGNKAYEMPIYGAALNHFTADQFIPYLYNVNWRYPERVQIFVKHDGDDEFHMYRLDLDAYKESYLARHGVPYIG